MFSDNFKIKTSIQKALTNKKFLYERGIVKEIVVPRWG